MVSDLDWMDLDLRCSLILIETMVAVRQPCYPNPLTFCVNFFTLAGRRVTTPKLMESRHHTYAHDSMLLCKIAFISQVLNMKLNLISWKGLII